MSKKLPPRCNSFVMSVLFVTNGFVAHIAYSQTKLPTRSTALPRLQEAALPYYPAIARAAHITGQVVVSLEVQGGRVTKAEAHEDSSHPNPAAIHYLNPATIANVETWHFAKDINESFTVTFTYEIAGEPSAESPNPTIELLPSLDVKVTTRPPKITTCMDGPCP
jgi:hypothetical protein